MLSKHVAVVVVVAYKFFCDLGFRYRKAIILEILIPAQNFIMPLR